jgi:S-adenosylmethionine:tRNA ribosyltransferase-isomerase
VAAPTAGLHFTPDVLSRVKQKGMQMVELTLHVSAGTFLPVSADAMQEHVMHAEVMEVSLEAIQTICNHQGPIISVGTTSCRSLESLYWLGCRAIRNEPLNEISQWEPYQPEAVQPTIHEALNALLAHLKINNLDSIVAETAILIAPGYQFRIMNGLITNFHQPKSTLLLLIAALIGNGWKEMYEVAIEEEYRFLSYGDACLLVPFGA